jgi:hypothetical protein
VFFTQSFDNSRIIRADDPEKRRRRGRALQVVLLLVALIAFRVPAWIRVKQTDFGEQLRMREAFLNDRIEQKYDPHIVVHNPPLELGTLKVASGLDCALLDVTSPDGRQRSVLFKGSIGWEPFALEWRKLRGANSASRQYSSLLQPSDDEAPIVHLESEGTNEVRIILYNPSREDPVAIELSGAELKSFDSAVDAVTDDLKKVVKQ